MNLPDRPSGVNDDSDCQADGPLVRACQLGDRDAQRRLYDLYSAMVFRLMARMAGTQDAADLTQQVFLQIYRRIQQFSGKSRFGTWLYRVAVNEALQHRRRIQSRPSQPLLFEPRSGEDRIATIEEREFLDRALASIEPDLRAIFLLREVDKLSYAELAQLLDVPAGTVGSRLNRARRELKAELARLETPKKNRS